MVILSDDYKDYKHPTDIGGCYPPMLMSESSTGYLKIFVTLKNCDELPSVLQQAKSMFKIFRYSLEIPSNFNLVNLD